jgi:hypothetical protein
LFKTGGLPPNARVRWGGEYGVPITRPYIKNFQKIKKNFKKFWKMIIFGKNYIYGKIRKFLF